MLWKASHRSWQIHQLRRLKKLMVKNQLNHLRLTLLQVIFVKKQGWERLIRCLAEKKRFFEQFRFYQDVEKIIHYLLVRQELEKLQLLKG